MPIPDCLAGERLILLPASRQPWRWRRVRCRDGKASRGTDCTISPDFLAESKPG
jgi:hypothetical protein